MKKLIIIPAYNEEKNILNVVRNIQLKIPDFDYVIINDGSTDGTLQVCRENNLNIVDLPINLGIGGAMQTGYKYALRNNYDYAVQIDGDGQHNCEEIVKLHNKMVKENLNMVIGSRFIKKEGFQSTIARRIGIIYFSKLIQILTRQKITDPTSGFRMCDKKVIQLFAKIYPRDYPEPESVVTVIKSDFKVSEVPTQMKERQGGVSSINALKSIYYMVKVTLAIFVTFGTNEKQSLCEE